MELETLLRRAVRRTVYHPFSEPRFAGKYPFARTRREIFHFTNSGPNPLIGPLIHKSLLPVSRRPINLYEDRRQYHPEGVYRPARSLVEARPRVVDIGGDVDGEIFHPRTGELIYTRKAYNPARVMMSVGNFHFKDPWKVFICLKRKMRKEVMHAFGYAGKTGFKKPKYTQYSKVRCF